MYVSYTRAMMAFLLFNPEPRHVLMIGLGGGSLAKYCHRKLPATRITVLELDHDVIALRAKFGIPAQHRILLSMLPCGVGPQGRACIEPVGRCH